MPIFNQNVSLQELLDLIPDQQISRIAVDTKVDYCAKRLHGKLMLSLLLYAHLSTQRLGLRGLSDVFSSPDFKLLFGYRHPHGIAHSSLSERLSEIDVDFFRLCCECIGERFTRNFPSGEICGLQVQRVDSTLVSEVAGKLKEGMTCGNDYMRKKMVKYTLNYDGMFGTCSCVHTGESYASESLALPGNVFKHFKKTQNHAQVYVFDRGQNATKAFKELNNRQGLLFVGRLMDNRKLSVVKELDLTYKNFTHGRLKQDALVHLYDKGKVQTDSTFRVIRFRPHGKGQDILLITNICYLRAETIALMYRRRWDIEVFFRFLKQELNFSHFLSLNTNGIEVVMYTILIAAMLVMIYKKENDIGYKTAIRKMNIEIQKMIILMVVKITGGDIRMLDKYNLDLFPRDG
jgi:hypothetical protein